MLNTIIIHINLLLSPSSTILALKLICSTSMVYDNSLSHITTTPLSHTMSRAHLIITLSDSDPITNNSPRMAAKPCSVKMSSRRLSFSR